MVYLLFFRCTKCEKQAGDPDETSEEEMDEDKEEEEEEEEEENEDKKLAENRKNGELNDRPGGDDV